MVAVADREDERVMPGRGELMDGKTDWCFFSKGVVLVTRGWCAWSMVFGYDRLFILGVF